MLQDATFKTEEKESEAAIPDPTAATENSSSGKVSKKRKRKRQHSTKTPLVSDGELNKSDDIEDIHTDSGNNLQVGQRRICSSRV